MATDRMLRKVLSICSLAASAIMAVVAVIVAAVWNPIDKAMITRADDAGWDTGLLFPHWQLLWLGINGTTILSVVLVGVNLAQVLVVFRKPRPSTADLLAGAFAIPSTHIDV